MKQLSVFFASGFYSGFSPFAPGTFGTLAGTLLLVLFWQMALLESMYVLPVIALLFTVLGYASIIGLPDTWIHDDQRIVVDEVIGLFVAMVCVPISISTLVASFILFRIFDIWKPLGIRRFDNFHSSFSVILDDIVAGVYANIVLQLGILLLPLI